MRNQCQCLNVRVSVSAINAVCGKSCLAQYLELKLLLIINSTMRLVAQDDENGNVIETMKLEEQKL